MAEYEAEQAEAEAEAAAEAEQRRLRWHRMRWRVMEFDVGLRGVKTRVFKPSRRGRRV